MLKWKEYTNRKIKFRKIALLNVKIKILNLVLNC